MTNVSSVLIFVVVLFYVRGGRRKGWGGVSESLTNVLSVLIFVIVLSYVRGKQLWHCRAGQLTKVHFSWAGLV